MTATVIILPVIAKPQALGGLDEATLPGLRLPRRVYGRLLRIAARWDVTPAAAAEMLLLGVINETSGVGKRGR